MYTFNYPCISLNTDLITSMEIVFIIDLVILKCRLIS